MSSSSRQLGSALLWLLLMAASAHAQSLDDIAEQAQEIVEDARGRGLDEILPGAQSPLLGDSLGQGTTPGTAMSVPAGSPAEGRLRQRYAFLVSMADRNVVRVALERARARQDVVVLFRGIEGQDFGAFFSCARRADVDRGAYASCRYRSSSFFAGWAWSARR